MDFDESDESIEEEDELGAELSRLLIDKLKLQFIIVCRYRKESALDEDKDPLHWWGAMKATISKILGAGAEIPLPAFLPTALRLRGFSVSVGFLFNESRLGLPFMREHAHAAFPQGQHRALIL